MIVRLFISEISLQLSHYSANIINKIAEIFHKGRVFLTSIAVRKYTQYMHNFEVHFKNVIHHNYLHILMAKHIKLLLTGLALWDKGKVTTDGPSVKTAALNPQLKAEHVTMSHSLLSIHLGQNTLNDVYLPSDEKLLLVGQALDPFPTEYFASSKLFLKVLFFSPAEF